MKKKLIAIAVLCCALPSAYAEQPDPQEAVPAPSIKSVHEQDFDAVIESTIPMLPDEIRKLKKILDEQKRAAAEPVRATIPRSRQVFVDVSPGADIPSISVNKGMVSTIVFMDRYGSPWPISTIRNGNERDYHIERVDNDIDVETQEGMSNAITISTDEYSMGNASIFLKGMVAPVIINIKSGDKYTDFRVDLRINKMGPASQKELNARVANSASLPAYDSVMLSILGGVPPKGKAYTYKVLPNRLGDVFSGEGRVFVRSSYKLMSPSKNIHKSADGTTVYEVYDTPVVLMLIDGSLERVRIK